MWERLISNKNAFAIGLGAVTWDSTFLVDKLPSPKSPPSVVNHESSQLGGPTANSLSILSEIGIRTILLSKIGDDREGDMILDAISNRGIEKQYIKRSSRGKSRRVLTFVNTGNGERSFVYRPDNIDQHIWSLDILNEFSNASIALFDEASDSAIHFARLVKEKGGLTVANLGWETPKLEELIENCGLVIASWTFAQSWLGNKSPLDAAKLISSDSKIGVITNGEEGAWLSGQNLKAHVPSINLGNSVLDTTGAGDAFVAGMAYGLSNGLESHRAAKLGAELAARSCCVLGGSGPIGLQKEDLLSKFF